MDPFSVLGVARGASQKDIKAAYKKLAKQYHPDLNGGDKEAEAKFKEVNEAYTTLTAKPQQGTNGPNFGSGPDFVDLSDLFSQSIFDQIFRGGASSRTVNRAPVDPEVLIQGGVFDYTVQVIENRNGRMRPINKTVKLTIEPDTPAGTRIAIPDTQPNHIFIELVPVDTGKYRVIDGIHLCENHQIDAVQAMFGSYIEILAPGQKKIAVKFPPGTQHGTVHRVRGMGLRHPSGHRGDYLVQLLVNIPAIKDEEELKAKISELKIGTQE